mmetsp:Transcript_31255/g.50498  ORF Transcript_31255/g.50498 Transcript_31255/m.50498 type:complete len:177 (-) Transcript_31255:15-545(-)
MFTRGTVAGSHKAFKYNKDYSLGVRQHLVKHFASEQGWLMSGEANPASYHSELLRSQMCIAPAGWELWSVRLFESILLGCIPVILSDDLHLPFQSQIDYSQFTIKVPHASLSQLPEILGAVSDETIRRKQASLKTFWKAVTYQTPPAPGDAWEHLLHELQARVHHNLRGTPFGFWA